MDNKAVLEILKSLPENLVELASQLEDYLERIESTFSTALDRTFAVKIDCRNDISMDIKEAADKAHAFIDSVDDIFWNGKKEKRISEIQRAMPDERKYLPLIISFLKEIKDNVRKAQLAYQEAHTAYNEVQRDAMRAADRCKERAKEEEKKKDITIGVGSTAAAGALVAGTAGGVAASVVAGVFTFGIGTVIGLGVTAAASTLGGAAIAGGTAVATHCIASEFKEKEEAFRDMQRAFDDIHYSCSRIIDSLDTIETELEEIPQYEVQKFESKEVAYHCTRQTTSAYFNSQVTCSEQYRKTTLILQRSNGFKKKCENTL